MVYKNIFVDASAEDSSVAIVSCTRWHRKHVCVGISLRL